MARSEESLEELVEAFAHHGAAQTDAIFRGDARTGNKHARMRYTTFDKLRARGDAGRDALAVLFKHPRMDVRAMAAAYLLRHRAEEARTVLLEISRGEGFAAFMASEALKRWVEGVWSLDPAEVDTGDGMNGQRCRTPKKKRNDLSAGQPGWIQPMKKARLKKLPIEQLVEMTRTISAERMRAIYAGKSKDGNRMFDLLIAIHRELQARGVEAQLCLLVLLDDPDPATRCWAATAVMEFAPKEGERVLTDLARNAGGLVGFSAEWTLEDWRAGTLKPL
ncbi:DUF2019 domain-containing protein [Archangium violaceum]|uniref:DUF2019 domain-containing protein n=1 Tax=Archangium violaceum TaxID=83451 RepID=UPI002B2F4F56|nr:DUF2019 domain-containing protein [Archangium gephyra]